MSLFSTRGAASSKGFGFTGISSLSYDSFFNYVTLLLKGDGTNNANNNAFVDSSTNNFTITRNGNTTQGSFSPYGNNWSNYFDGSGDYLTVTNNAAFDLGTGDFTIEFSVYITGSSQYQSPVALYNPSTNGYCGTSIDTTNGDFYFSITNDAGTVQVFSTRYTIPGWSRNQWFNLAVTRSGTTISWYSNGTRIGTATTTESLLTAPNVMVGGLTPNFNGNPVQLVTGYLSNVRIIKGTALYTGSSYTVSTTPLTAVSGTSLLTCQSNRFIDNSTNNFAITRNGDVSVQRFSPFSPTAAYSTSVIGGSGYFDGTGDLIYCTPSNLTGQFTIEGWYYATSFPAPAVFFGNWSTGCLLRKSGSNLEWYCSPGGTSSSTQTINTNQWYHIAVTRDASNVQRVFLNGVLASSATGAGTVTMANFCIGAEQTISSTSDIWAGYISNFRILNGTCLYTSTFTPPTTPLTAIANTNLLCNFTNGAIFDNAMMNNLETVTSAQISTAQSKFGGGSITFPVNDSYLLAPPTVNLEFGSGDFTIEFWWYPTSTGRQALYHGSFGADWSIGIDYSSVSTNQKIGIWASSNGSSWNLINADGGGNGIGTTTVTQNGWNHIAYVRNGTTWMLFVNGNRDLNLTGISGSIVNRSTYQKGIGVWWNSSSFAEASGYIDDLRITKGYARYTANFTSPISLPTS